MSNLRRISEYHISISVLWQLSEIRSILSQLNDGIRYEMIEVGRYCVSYPIFVMEKIHCDGLIFGPVNMKLWGNSSIK